MSSPPLLVGATLLFWGWQTGLWIPGACMALILEASRPVKWKWDLSPRDFYRIADLCSVLTALMAIAIYASNPTPSSLWVIIQWLPVASFLLFAAQAYSTSGKVGMGALFFSLRKARNNDSNPGSTGVDITYPYLAGCILSASAANARTPWFYAGLFVLCAWSLGSFRSKRISFPLWMGLFTAVGIMGWFGQVGLHHLQGVVEKKATEWFSDNNPKDTDPIYTRTAIGKLGKLKLSERILFRVETAPGQAPPALLHEASYDVLRGNAWFSSRAEFAEPVRDRAGRTCRLASDFVPQKNIDISQPLRKGRGLLRLPGGTVDIRGLQGAVVERNRFGTVRIKEGPGLLRYRIGFDPRKAFEGSPTKADLVVPEALSSTLEKIFQELRLSPSTPPGEILKKISAHFLQNFSYALILNTEGRGPKTIENFLTQSRAGHCEYFAMATTLLLRTAGLPARYVTGYSVQEFSQLEKCFVVREKHAHAWVRVFRHGAWHDFDTTPPTGFAMEQENASFIDPLYDLLSWARFKLAEWRWGPHPAIEPEKIMLWLLIPLGLLFIIRVKSKKRVRKEAHSDKNKDAHTGRRGMHSPFFLLEKTLKTTGHPRHTGETYATWIKRMEDSSPVSYDDLLPLLDLHYRWRFDPRGITEDEKKALISGVKQWIDRYERQNS